MMMNQELSYLENERRNLINKKEEIQSEYKDELIDDENINKYWGILYSIDRKIEFIEKRLDEYKKEHIVLRHGMEQRYKELKNREEELKNLSLNLNEYRY